MLNEAGIVMYVLLSILLYEGTDSSCLKTTIGSNKLVHKGCSY